LIPLKNTRALLLPISDHWLLLMKQTHLSADADNSTATVGYHMALDSLHQNPIVMPGHNDAAVLLLSEPSLVMDRYWALNRAQPEKP
jgi:hypothetical protein